jgi:hypothetical protein
MATVNQDGSPHNSPFLFLHDPELKHVYWGSHPDSEHSKNVLRTGQLFVVLYDAIERGGLYLRCEGAKILDGEELKQALAIHNVRRTGRNQDQLPLEYYTGASLQRMWGADIKQLWVNGTLRDQNDHVIQDVRAEVTADMLAQ